MIVELSDKNEIIDQKVARLRDNSNLLKRDEFSFIINELGLVVGYEIAKSLTFINKSVNTPIGQAQTKELDETVVIAGILRAGLPFQNGIGRVFSDSDQAFIGARRVESNTEIGVDLNYIAGPPLQNKTLIIADTMLATGHSLLASYEALTAKLGRPSKTIIATVISSKPGIDYIAEKIPDTAIYACVIDPELTPDFYINPGLGDAGDRLYGEKI